MLDPFDEQSPYAFWHVDRDWNFVYSDLCFMEVSPDDGSADQMAAKWPRRPFDLHLLPPPVGAIVQAFGYPKHAAHSRGSKVYIDAPATFVEGTVIDVYSPYRERGLMSFPCFAVEMVHKIDHGFSGGPVFYDGQLAGIISAASDFDSIAYVASLWPLLRNDKIVHLLRTWQLAAHGWEDLRARVTLCDDDRGSFLDLAEPEKTS